MTVPSRTNWLFAAIIFCSGLLVGAMALNLQSVLPTWRLTSEQASLWDIALKAVAGNVAIFGAVITAHKYIDDKNQQNIQRVLVEKERIEQNRREERRIFLKERQETYQRLAKSLAKLMNYDPKDRQWNGIKEQFFEIYWSEIKFVANDEIINLVELFSTDVHNLKENEPKSHFDHQVNNIVQACRRSLGEAWQIS